jgi:hypothetical protein
MLIAAFAVVLLVCPVTASGTAGRTFGKDATGSMVVRIQLRLRELGYLNFKPTGSYRSMTVEAVKAFQKNCREAGLSSQVDGVMGAESLELLFKQGALRASLSDVYIPSGPRHAASTLEKTGVLVPWESVKEKLAVGRSYVITDCLTGNTYELVFTGGTNHAEMESQNEEQLVGFKATCGKEFNYLKRPITVDIDGQQVAASIQCWPHGTDSIGGNGMDGHVCVFFEGSVSSVGNLPDIEHTENIYRAAGK